MKDYNFILFFLTLVIPYIIGLLSFPPLIKMIINKNLVDAPGGRKVHQNVTPSMGGIGILLGFMTVLGFCFFLSDWEHIFLIVIGTLMMGLLGFFDDWKNISALKKLIGQLVIIVTLIWATDIRFQGLYGFFGIHDLPLGWSYFITVFVIVGLTNAFNLIDGLDGLAGSLSLISFFLLGVWFYLSGHEAYTLLCLSMVGATSAFLWFNWHPAKIFMGDTGSLSVGFLLSVFTVLFIDLNGYEMNDHNPFRFNAPIAAGLTLMIIPCCDTMRVFVRRIRRGKSPFTADKSHIHHFLLRMGYGHDKVTLILCTVKILLIGLATIGYRLSDNFLIPLLVFTVIGLGTYLDRVTLRRIKRKFYDQNPVENQDEQKALST
ncbi:undecaprenyl/decaprenyl-phosphate alpha-N-acetylglucosaminyl 1-phosphate transferase [Echinicola marina]|uniref:glycosyltransferase family 4 protein n=1 Tax=Echinicola marina TaxID=2859768 RepID=UPI001CF6B7D3|nr:MraY family glycosyltransferase [Echinicola marina]UCS93970.1 undecaprenyl/decaprenyl-phosphate alpha-N-acetylglucosaminyl 1-phosphate transferase [Echinicola marina]